MQKSQFSSLLTCPALPEAYIHLMAVAFNKFLRRISPRSFMWRVALMIILPLLVLQISLGILIVQRYFDFVTKQLTSAVVFDIHYLEDTANSEAEFDENMEIFSYEIVDRSRMNTDEYRFADLSGHYILESFQENYSPDAHIDSRLDEIVFLQIPTRFGEKIIRITRKRLAPVNPHQILLNTTLFAIIVLIVVLLFLRNQVRSIRYLARAAEAFGRGDMIPYEPRGASEIRLAGRNFIAMRARINRQREQRNLMLSGISHDLRTPLTRFRLAVEMMDDETTKAEMLRDIDDMENLVDSFLSYANNTATEARETVSLKAFLEGIQAEEPEIGLKVAEDQQISIRPFLLKRALLNLIGNAKRFSKTIEVHTEKTRNFVRIFVDDDGPGIPKDQRQHALMAFQRLDVSRNQDGGAHAGLGMAIAADAVRQQGGELRLEDSPLGGLRAVIELPLNRS